MARRLVKHSGYSTARSLRTLAILLVPLLLFSPAFRKRRGWSAFGPSRKGNLWSFAALLRAKRFDSVQQLRWFALNYADFAASSPSRAFLELAF
jgi:hypothetical protein